MPLKSSYKSSSTRHLYEIAEEIAPAAVNANSDIKAANRRNDS